MGYGITDLMRGIKNDNSIHEYGKNNAKTVVLVHPSVVMWDFFEYVVPLLEKEYHVIIPALPGYDDKNSQQDFTSVENIAGEFLKYMAKVFRFISYKTIWRTFESCNNYRMPEDTIKYPGKLEYWYGDKDRNHNILISGLQYVVKYFPGYTPE